MDSSYGLSPAELLRSIDATRDTLGRPRLNLIDVVAGVREVTNDAPYAVVGGLAQILWARKTHTDDLDVVLACSVLPSLHESDTVLEVCHLLCDGSVVDLVAFCNEGFNSEIVRTSVEVPELGGLRFVRPELLLVTHLLRPGPRAAVAAVELILARAEHGGLDAAEARLWAERLGRVDRLERVQQLARTFALE